MFAACSPNGPSMFPEAPQRSLNFHPSPSALIQQSLPAATDQSDVITGQFNLQAPNQMGQDKNTLTSSSPEVPLPPQWWPSPSHAPPHVRGAVLNTPVGMTRGAMRLIKVPIRDSNGMQYRVNTESRADCVINYKYCGR